VSFALLLLISVQFSNLLLQNRFVSSFPSVSALRRHLLLVECGFHKWKFIPCLYCYLYCLHSTTMSFRVELSSVFALHSWSQSVRVDGHYADWAYLMSAVPQWPVLAPLPFLLLTDDLSTQCFTILMTLYLNFYPTVQEINPGLQIHCFKLIGTAIRVTLTSFNSQYSSSSHHQNTNIIWTGNYAITALSVTGSSRRLTSSESLKFF